MDLKAILLRGHSKENMTQVIDYVGHSKQRFEQLINLFLSGPYRITQRAAWPISHCVEQHPGLLKGQLAKMLDFIDRAGAPVAARRNVIRLLQFAEIPTRYHARIINMCFGFLQDRKEAIAVKVFSMTTLERLARYNPDIRRELEMVIEEQLPYASAAFRSRAAKIASTIRRS